MGYRKGFPAVSRNFLTLNYTTKGQQNMKQSKIYKMVLAAMIAAMYTAISLALAPISFGTIQMRAAEALTLLPVFDPVMIVGVSLGCLVTNTVGFFTGADILGWMDILFGTLATVIAAVLSYWLRNVRFKGLPVLSALPPVLLNALIIGGELTFLIAGRFQWEVFALQAFSVGAGELVSCFVLGLPLVWMLEKSGIPKKLFPYPKTHPAQSFQAEL